MGARTRSLQIWYTKKHCWKTLWSAIGGRITHSLNPFLKCWRKNWKIDCNRSAALMSINLKMKKYNGKITWPKVISFYNSSFKQEKGTDKEIFHGQVYRIERMENTESKIMDSQIKPCTLGLSRLLSVVLPLNKVRKKGRI